MVLGTMKKPSYSVSSTSDYWLPRYSDHFDAEPLAKDLAASLNNDQRARIAGDSSTIEAVIEANARLLEDAGEATQRSQRLQSAYEKAVFAGAVAGGATGVFFGYPEAAEVSANVASYLNDASLLLSPLTGVAQTTISLLGGAASVLVGGFLGAVGTSIVASPLTIIHDRKERRWSGHDKLQKELYRARANE